MITLGKFLTDLGGLHDAVVKSIVFQSNTIEIVFDDLYVNFIGFPEDPGRKGGSIILRGVSNVFADFDLGRSLRVFEMFIENERRNKIVMKLSPEGSFSAQFDSAEHPANLVKVD